MSWDRNCNCFLIDIEDVYIDYSSLADITLTLLAHLCAMKPRLLAVGVRLLKRSCRISGIRQVCRRCQMSGRLKYYL
jgi:hypothetical protein